MPCAAAQPVFSKPRPERSVIVSENNEASWGLIAKCGELARERGLLLRAYRVPSGGPEHTEAVRKTLEAMYYRSGPEAVIFERSEFLAAVAPAFAAVNAH